ASYFPGAQLEDAQKRGMRDGTVTELAPELEVVSRAADGTPLETRFKKPVANERRILEIGANRSEERRVGKECSYRWGEEVSSRRRHTRFDCDWSSDVCSSDLASYFPGAQLEDAQKRGMRDGTVTELAPELEVVSRAADGTPLETRFKKPVANERRILEIGAN